MSVETRGLVLVAEDERPIADLLGMYLRRDGFGVHVVLTGPDALAAARRLHPVAMILDVGLPGMDGTEVCRALRAEGDSVPILFCTARDDEIDRVLGLEMGGDDYITKPFSPREVVARVKAVLRRADTSPGALAEPGQVVRAGPLTIDPARREARLDGELLLVAFPRSSSSRLVPKSPQSRKEEKQGSHTKEPGIRLAVQRIFLTRILRLLYGFRHFLARHH